MVCLNRMQALAQPLSSLPKAAKPTRVWFYDLMADGFSLMINVHQFKITICPDLIKAIRSLSPNTSNNQSTQQWADKNKKRFLVNKANIAAQK